MFAGLGAIVVDCCSVDKEVMQKGSKKNYDLFIARIEGSGDRVACGCRPYCSKK
jgi:hypothetical protein